MANGGGNWVTQNKTLPGFYANVVSKKYASMGLADRGICTVPMILPWGPDGVMRRITAEDFYNKTFELFGVDYSNDSLAGLREIFKHATVCYVYNLNNNGAASKATIYNGSAAVATAKYYGSAGNNLSLVLTPIFEEGVETGAFDAVLKMGTKTVFTQQNVESPNDMNDNDYVVWNKAVSPAEPVPFTSSANTTSGGADKQTVINDDLVNYVIASEGYAFNVMIMPFPGTGSASTDPQAYICNYVKRMRTTVGKLFQVVVYNYTPAEGFEGVISVKSYRADKTADDTSLVYWVGGAEAGCPVNQSLVNSIYDGEYDVDVHWSQADLEGFVNAGQFVFHNVDGEPRVLDDINTFTEFTESKNYMFGQNQTIRVTDGLLTAEAAAFNSNYMGAVQNDDTGRALLWNRFNSIKDQFVAMRAIEPYDAGALVVSQGEANDSVVVTDEIQVIACMKKLYMTVYLI